MFGSRVMNNSIIPFFFLFLAPVFSDRVVAFLLQKLETNNDKARIASLSIIKHLINSSGKRSLSPSIIFKIMVLRVAFKITRFLPHLCCLSQASHNIIIIDIFWFHETIYKNFVFLPFKFFFASKNSNLGNSGLSLSNLDYPDMQARVNQNWSGLSFFLANISSTLLYPFCCIKSTIKLLLVLFVWSTWSGGKVWNVT